VNGAGPAPLPGSSRHSWMLLALACAAATVFVGLLAPPLALVGAVLLAYSTWRARRAPSAPHPRRKGSR
jgi:membrane protein required for beta-lactamase induction